MNLMGFSADGLGNHNFDKGSAYMRNTLIPARELPVPVGERRRRGREDARGVVAVDGLRRHFGGTKLGLIGFSNEDADRRWSSPATLDPFHVIDSARRCNAEAAKLAGKNKSGPIVAMGHLGATAGTLSNPTGPLIDFADKLIERRRGDRRPHRLPGEHDAAERRARRRRTGARASASLRVRLVVDTSTKEVVYKTADFHKPWDDRRHARPDDPGADRRAERRDPADPRTTWSAIRLVAIPRADACGTGNGRHVRVEDRRRDGRRAPRERRPRRVRDHELGRPARRPDVSACRRRPRASARRPRRRPYPITRGRC